MLGFSKWTPGVHTETLVRLFGVSLAGDVEELELNQQLLFRAEVSGFITVPLSHWTQTALLYVPDWSLWSIFAASCLLQCVGTATHLDVMRGRMSIFSILISSSPGNEK